jgi:hypothetical protein
MDQNHPIEKTRVESLSNKALLYGAEFHRDHGCYQTSSQNMVVIVGGGGVW